MIDTALAHTRDRRCFGAGQGDACNTLYVIHPLWLAGTQTDHRREEIQRWARGQLDRILAGWQPGAGISSAYSQDLALMSSPALQGTEMWLAITWYLADTLNHSDTLGYAPRGVHNPVPAMGPGRR